MKMNAKSKRIQSAWPHKGGKKNACGHIFCTSQYFGKGWLKIRTFQLSLLQNFVLQRFDCLAFCVLVSAICSPGHMIYHRGHMAPLSLASLGQGLCSVLAMWLLFSIFWLHYLSVQHFLCLAFLVLLSRSQVFGHHSLVIWSPQPPGHMFSWSHGLY